MTHSLIANSGLQFLTTYVDINLQEPLMLPNQKKLEYNFIEDNNFITNQRFIDLAYFDSASDHYYMLSEMRDSGMIEYNSNGTEKLDYAGTTTLDPAKQSQTALLVSFSQGSAYKIGQLGAHRIRLADGSQTTMFEMLIGKWLPMPMYRVEDNGITSSTPMGWCRVKIDDCGKADNAGARRYRCVWAFDTDTTQDWFSKLRPGFFNDETSLNFMLCNKADQLLDFMSLSDSFHPFSTYIASLINQDLKNNNSRKFIAQYIYIINYLRLSGAAPQITLYNNPKQIPVDMVIDIGNSRTCGIFFENGEFTRATTQGLRDLTRPWIHYRQEAYDMRVVFRRANFGNEIVIDAPEAKTLFQWNSFVRIGREAQHLIYRSLEDDGLAQKTTNYSSPKRYLWDIKPFDGNWENEITTDDENPQLNKIVALPNLSEFITSDGTYNTDGISDISALIGNVVHYSRSSLMMFAFIEIFQQALCEINSIKYREKWGDINLKRYLRTIIITCPTAMPQVEQVRLRGLAINAYDAISKNMPYLQPVEILPKTDALKINDPLAPIDKRTWIYDEAFSSQLVYLYAEIHERYNGEINRMFEHKGHVRSDLAKEGYSKKSLTIGTVDIGAGTTDVMICTYKQAEANNSTLTPIPLYWDSFYLAGDDIMRQLVLNIVIEGKDQTSPMLGGISSAIKHRITALTDEQLKQHPVLKQMPEYIEMVNNIVRCLDDNLKQQLKEEFAAELVHSFFGNDTSLMSFRDRRCRLYFNTQISIPIVQLWLELLRQNSPSRLYTFDNIFSEEMRPSQYLLDYFAEHFGFRFEELNWRFDPQEVARIVRSTMEPLMKQIAQVLFGQQCDIIVLSGRPSSLKPITEFFFKYLPVSPDRLICLNDYHVGNWFPTANASGFFMDQKTVVAVGAMIGYMASTQTKGLPGLVLDLSQLIKKMTSTANYIGQYNATSCQVPESMLKPKTATATINTAQFPFFLGCKQFDAPYYQARPLYAIYNHSSRTPLTIYISRDFYENREVITIDDITDADNNNINKNKVELIQQSIADDGLYWLDKGEFTLTIIKN